MKTLYVAEINGRGIAAFNVTDELMAKKFVKQELFESELMVLENDGKPLWDGHSDISVRPATQAEAKVWSDEFGGAWASGEFLEQQMTWSANARTDWFFSFPVRDAPTTN